MPFFNRDRSRNVDTEPAQVPAIALDHDATRIATTLLDQFEAAVGMDGPLRHAANAVARAGGFTTFLDIVMTKGDPDRPWKWLAAVADQAVVENDFLLVGRIYAFVDFWTVSIAPLLGPSDWMEIGLDRPQPPTEAHLTDIAFECLRRLPPDTTLASNSTGTITAKAMTIAAAIRLCRLDDTGVTVTRSNLEEARHLLATYRQP